MSSLEEQARRGERARAILEDELVTDAFARIEAECLDAWRRSLPEDREGRERLYLAIGLLDRLRRDFVSIVETGRLAAFGLAERAAPTPKA